MENQVSSPRLRLAYKKMVKFRSWKTWRSHGKGHDMESRGISKALKSTNPG